MSAEGLSEITQPVRKEYVELLGDIAIDVGGADRHHPLVHVEDQGQLFAPAEEVVLGQRRRQAQDASLVGDQGARERLQRACCSAWAARLGSATASATGRASPARMFASDSHS